jgi:hypothetical protein
MHRHVQAMSCGAAVAGSDVFRSTYSTHPSLPTAVNEHVCAFLTRIICLLTNGQLVASC